MWIIFLEIAIALALVLTVVWATWPRRQDDDDTGDDGPDTPEQKP